MPKDSTCSQSVAPTSIEHGVKRQPPCCVALTQEVRRLGTDDTGNESAFSDNVDSLPEQHMPPPAA